MSIDSKIGDIIQSMIKSKYKSFCPEYIKNLFPELSLKDITDKLDLYVKQGHITLRFEIRCPDDFAMIKVVDDCAEIMGTEIYCAKCGKELLIDENNIYLKYFINNE